MKLDRIRGKISIALLIGLFFMGLAGNANATVIDQSYTSINKSFQVNTSLIFWQQEVTVVGLPGTLAGIEFYDIDIAGNVTLNINKGSGWRSDNHDYETTISIPGSNSWFYVDLLSAGISLNAGDTFVFGLSGLNEVNGLGLRGGDDYLGGTLYRNGNPYPLPNNGFAYRTHMDISSIPEPSTYLLLGSGILGLVFWRRRRKG